MESFPMHSGDSYSGSSAVVDIDENHDYERKIDNGPLIGTLRNSASTPALSDLTRQKIASHDSFTPGLFDLRGQAPVVAHAIIKEDGSVRNAGRPEHEKLRGAKSLPDLRAEIEQEIIDELVDLELHGRLAWPGMNSHVTRLRAATLELPEQERREGSIHLVEETGFTLPLVIAVLQAILPVFVYGYHIGVTNVPADLWEKCAKVTASGFCQHDTAAEHFTKMAPLNFQMCNSALFGGLFLSSFAAAPLSDRFGRKMVFLIADGILIGASILFFFANGFGMFFTARILAGIGSGLAQSVVPTYLGEVSPVALSGTVGAFFQFSLVSGILVATVLGKSTILGGPKTVKYLLSAGALLCAFNIVTSWTFPRSPKWLMTKGREQECKEILQLLRNTKDVDDEMMIMRGGSAGGKKRESKGRDNSSKTKLRATPTNDALLVLPEDLPIANDGDTNRGMKERLLYNPEPSVSKSLTINEAQSRMSKDKSNGLCSSPTIRMAFFIAVMLQVIQQWGGINAVMLYSSQTFTSVNFDPWLGTVLIQSFNFLGVAAAIPLVDRLGRRILLFISLFGQALAMAFVTTAVIEQDHGRGGHVWSIGTVVAYCAYVFTFELGMGAIPFLLTSEISPISHRATIGSAASVSNGLNAIIVGVTAPNIVHAVNNFPFLAVCFFGMVFVFAFVPETKGLTFAEIQKVMAKMAGGS